jgi:hypothetical protein
MIRLPGLILVLSSAAALLQSGPVQAMSSLKSEITSPLKKSARRLAFSSMLPGRARWGGASTGVGGAWLALLATGAAAGGAPGPRFAGVGAGVWATPVAPPAGFGAGAATAAAMATAIGVATGPGIGAGLMAPADSGL